MTISHQVFEPASPTQRSKHLRASTAPAPQWLEARIEGGEYVALGSYAITSVPGRPDLAPTAWRLEGLEPFSLNRQTLDEAVGQTTLELFRLEGAKPRKSFLSAWTSGAPPPQWLEYDLGQVRTLAEFSLTSGTCTVCTFQEGPSVISLQATNLPPESNGRAWYELRSPFSVGSMWSSGETRRWNLPEGEVRSFRYWRLNFHETMGGGGTVYKVHVSEVGLYAPATTFRLVVGEWGVCEPLGGYGACGAGVSRRSVQCFDDEDYPQSLDNCEHGLTTAAEMSCTEMLELLCRNAKGLAQTSALKASAEELCKVGGSPADAAAVCRAAAVTSVRRMVAQRQMHRVLCAAYEVPIGDEPSATNLDYALYSGIGMAESTNGTAEVWGILVSRFAGEEFEVFLSD
eukprot:g21097.t1